jgi:hypothetical protein
VRSGATRSAACPSLAKIRQDENSLEGSVPTPALMAAIQDFVIATFSIARHLCALRCARNPSRVALPFELNQRVRGHLCGLEKVM